MTKEQLEELVPITVAVVIGAVFIAIIIWLASWGAGIRANRAAQAEIDLQKTKVLAETCYTEYEWDAINKINVVKLTYCGEPNGQD